MRHREDDLQINCRRWFCLQYPKYAKLLHHSPNGGFRNPVEAAKFKAMGTISGFADFILLVPNKKSHALFIELKTAKGRQTDNQKEFERAVTSQGYYYALCRSLTEFMGTIVGYLNNK